MAEYTLERESFVPQPKAVVFDFFSRAENLETLTPPWLSFRILTPRPVAMRRGATIAYRVKVHGIPIQWLTGIERWDPPDGFIDVQLEGPYKVWRHTHRFSDFEGGAHILDRVEYSLPLGWLGRLAHQLQIRRDLTRIFDYREQRVHELFG